MDCEWKSIRFYGFSMDSNDQTGSSDGRPTDEGVLPEVGGELDHFVAAECAVCAAPAHAGPRPQ